MDAPKAAVSGLYQYSPAIPAVPNTTPLIIANFGFMPNTSGL